MDKRFLLTIVLTFIVLFIWQLFFFKPQPPNTSTSGDTSNVQSEVQVENGHGGREALPTPSGNPLTLPETTTTIVVESPLYRAEISLLGGGIKSFTLKRFKLYTGDPVQLIPQNRPYLLADYGDTNDLSIFYTPNKSKVELEGDSEDTLILTAKLNEDTIRKIFVFNGNTYLINTKIEAPKPFSLILSQGINPTEKNRKRDISKFQALFYREKLKKYSLKTLRKKTVAELGKGLIWTGIRSKYFFFATVWSSPIKIVNARGQDSLITLSAKVSNGNAKFMIYLGPIDYFLLKELGYGLSSVYSFGFALFSPFARAILYIFHFLQRFIPNYGVIIILIALLMKVVFWPLTIKSLRSMRKMQELKPKLDALRKLYKDDPQRLQKEMMELYKQYKVNPFSSCFILLLQLPIFWALYQILQNTIELRGAPFVLWIKDLSSKDPYYILPILMGATSLLQALMQPAQDQQSRMFSLFMPIFLTFIFLNFPSGIVLYWLTYSALSVIEQFWLKKT